MRETWTRRAAATLAAAGLLLVACGGDGDVAEDLIPDLSDQGFAVVEEERDQFLPEATDAYRAIFLDSADSSHGALTAVYVEDSEAVATATYNMLATALQRPPAEFFGGEAVQKEAPSLGVGDISAAYVTEQPDRNGRVIWTDIYLSGRTVLITQVLGRYDVDHTEFRQLIAERVFADAP